MKVIDVHVYFGKWYFPVPNKSIEDILQMMREREIEQAILMSSISILQDFREGNRKVLEAIAPYDNLWGYCFINGNYIEESLAEMERYLPLPKCKGVKYHPEYSNKAPHDPEVRPLFETLARKYKKPALIHSWPIGEHGNTRPNSHPRFHAELAAALPELNIVMGHMGGPEWVEAIEIAKPYPNLYLDICSSYTHYDKVKSAVDVLGAERVLFGTGMTEGYADTHLGVVFDSAITEEQKRIVLYEGANKLFGL
jgi:uncharacterized protein